MDFSILDPNLRWADFWRHAARLRPEMLLILGMCAVILAPFLNRRNLPQASGYIAIATLGAAFAAALLSLGEDAAWVFHGSLAVDSFSQFFKVILYAFTILITMQWFVVRDRKLADADIPDFFCLLLGATFGMSLMASANNLLTIVVAMESASLPSFALAGFRKRSRMGTESSLKYVVFGAAASAFMIYGMSLVYGAVGTLDLHAIARAAAPTVVAGKMAGGITPLLAVGLVAMFAGIAFKLSAVPMHFWCPDVFEGASIEVTTFLSVASKGAAIALLARVLSAFGEAGQASADAARHVAVITPFVGLATAVAILGGATAFVGNLVAYHQTNIKRLLAYSSIAHAGYMIMAASVLASRGSTGVATHVVAAGLLFYLLVYMFMNLGAFTLAALIAQRTGSEDHRDYAGLIHRNPWLGGLMAVCLLSLFGFPGLGGFWAKIFLVKGIADAGTGGLVIIGVVFLNTLISFFYYMRPVVAILLGKPGTGPSAAGKAPSLHTGPITPDSGGLVLAMLCGLVLVVTGLSPGLLENRTRDFGLVAVRDPNKKAPATSQAPAAKPLPSPAAAAVVPASHP